MIKLHAAISDVLIITSAKFTDKRGYLMDTFNKHDLNKNFVYEYQCFSVQGVLKGLHYQLPHPQAKLIRVVYGEIFDVAVDLRVSSLTFGKWVGGILSAENSEQIYIPEGFAHGYYVLSDAAKVIYKNSDYYFPDCGRTMAWDDPQLKITWPIPEGQSPILSDKDVRGDRFEDSVWFK